MSFMFNNCNSLGNINIKFDTHNVETMESMFNKCQNLTFLNLSSFNTIQCENFDNMFKNSGVETIIINIDNNNKLLRNIPQNIDIVNFPNNYI